MKAFICRLCFINLIFFYNFGCVSERELIVLRSNISIVLREKSIVRLPGSIILMKIVIKTFRTWFKFIQNIKKGTNIDYFIWEVSNKSVQVPLKHFIMTIIKWLNIICVLKRMYISDIANTSIRHQSIYFTDIQKIHSVDIYTI